MTDAVVTDIHAPHLYEGVGLPMWVLYDHPRDMPDHFVMRLWDGMLNKPTPFVFLARTLEETANAIHAIPGRFYRMDRFVEDDPKIMAVFV